MSGRLAVALVVTVFTTPPALLSEQGMARMGVLLLVVAAGLAAAVAQRRGTVLHPEFRRFLAWVLGFETWVLIVLVVFPSTIVFITVYSATVVVATCIAAAYLLSDHQTARRSAALMVWVLALLGYSGLVTWALLLLGVPSSRLAIMPLKLYAQWQGNATTSLFFPLTAEAGNISLAGMTLPRSAGGMREPGLSQLFVVIGLIVAVRLKMSRLLVGGLIGGLVVSGSTAGVVSLTVAALVSSAVGSRSASPLLLYAGRLTGVLVTGLGAWALIELPSIGILDKDTQSGSVDARRQAVTSGLSSLVDHPLGTGFGHVTGDMAINLIGIGSEIGWPGLVLITGTYLSLAWGRRLGSRYLPTLCSVVFVTGLSSQPLLNMPGLYVAMLIAAGAVAGDHGASPTSDPSAGDRIGGDGWHPGPGAARAMWRD